MFSSQDSYLGTSSRKPRSWLVLEHSAVVVGQTGVWCVYTQQSHPKEKHKMKKNTLLLHIKPGKLVKNAKVVKELKDLCGWHEEYSEIPPWRLKANASLHRDMRVKKHHQKLPGMAT